MPSVLNPRDVPLIAGMPAPEHILGVATLDVCGFPQEYFVTSRHGDTAWVQLAFQSVGLKDLLAKGFQTPAFKHANIHTQVGDIVVLPTKAGYLAVLLRRYLPHGQLTIDHSWLGWASRFSANLGGRQSV